MCCYSVYKNCKVWKLGKYSYTQIFSCILWLGKTIFLNLFISIYIEIINDQNDEKKRYIGLTETTFKTRYGNHVKSFKHRKYSKETELSKYIWELKDDNKVPIIKRKFWKQ